MVIVAAEEEGEGRIEVERTCEPGESVREPSKTLPPRKRCMTPSSVPTINKLSSAFSPCFPSTTSPGKNVGNPPTPAAEKERSRGRPISFSLSRWSMAFLAPNTPPCPCPGAPGAPGGGIAEEEEGEASEGKAGREAMSWAAYEVGGASEIEEDEEERGMDCQER